MSGDFVPKGKCPTCGRCLDCTPPAISHHPGEFVSWTSPIAGWSVPGGEEDSIDLAKEDLEE